MTVSLSRDFIATAATRARLCKHLYVLDSVAPPDGWNLLATSDDLYPNASGFFAAVYQRLRDNNTETVVAIRGLNDRQDLTSIFNIFKRRLPPQHNDTLAFIDRVCEKFGIDSTQLEVTGHSLGGYLARTVARVREFRKTWSFGGPGPDEKTQAALEKLRPSRLPNDAIVNVRSRHDIVALFGPDEKMTIELNTPYYHHDIGWMGYALGKKSGHTSAPDALDQPAPGRIKAIFNSVSRAITGICILRHLIKKISSYDRAAHGAPPAHIIDLPRAPEFTSARR